LDDQETKETPAWTVCPELKDHLDQEVDEEQQAPQECSVCQDDLDPMEAQDLWVTEVLLDQLVMTVLTDPTDLQVTPDELAKVVDQAPKVLLEEQAATDLVVSEEQPVPPEHLDHVDDKEKSEHLAKKEASEA
jgi:hypothetical protein